jgi:hypothetical protein
MWYNLGITDFSFIHVLQIIFFVIFIILNICLVYIGYKNKKSSIKNKPEFLLSGPSSNSIAPILRTYTGYFLASITALSGLITVKNEFDKWEIQKKAIEEYKKNNEKLTSENTDLKTKSVIENLNNKLHLGSVKCTLND